MFQEVVHTPIRAPIRATKRVMKLISLRNLLMSSCFLGTFFLLLTYTSRSFIRDVFSISFITTKVEEAESSFRELKKATQSISLESSNLSPPVSSLLQHAYFTLDEMRNFLLYEINQVGRFVADRPHVKGRLNRIHKHSMQYVRAMELQMDELESDFQLKEKRIETWHRLSDSVQSRIYNLQKSKNCNRENNLLCSLDSKSGFASAIHDVMWCLVQAYYTGKRMILDSEKWHYNPGGNWTYIFRSLTDSTCTEKEKRRFRKISGSALNDDFHRGILTNLPYDIGPEMLTLGLNPLPWWYGQFIGYIISPNEELKAMIWRIKESIGFVSPIVGLHIRRTDKIGTEGDFHSISEYMWHVENFYAKLSLEGKNVEVKNVFIATDDPRVHNECRESFPNYTFIFNEEFSELAMNMETRYSKTSMWGILVDVYLLAKSDFVVCTFSSGLCRLAYELMQYLQPDALNKVHSIDVPHHYAWSFPPVRKAIFNYEGSLKMKTGDDLQINSPFDFETAAAAGKRNDGFYSAINLRTKQLGDVPYFNTKPIFQFVKFNNDENRYEKYNETT